MLTTSLCLMQGVLYELLIGFKFGVLFLSVLLIATCGRLSWPAALWTTFGLTINSDWLCDCLIDQFLKVFFVIIASSCILSTCSMSARDQCEASTWRHDAHFATVVRGRWSASGLKNALTIVFSDHDFLYTRCIFTDEWRLRYIVDVFALLQYVAWPCDLLQKSSIPSYRLNNI